MEEYDDTSIQISPNLWLRKTYSSLNLFNGYLGYAMVCPIFRQTQMKKKRTRSWQKLRGNRYQSWSKWNAKLEPTSYKNDLEFKLCLGVSSTPWWLLLSRLACRTATWRWSLRNHWMFLGLSSQCWIFIAFWFPSQNKRGSSGQTTNHYLKSLPILGWLPHHLWCISRSNHQFFIHHYLSSMIRLENLCLFSIT